MLGCLEPASLWRSINPSTRSCSNLHGVPSRAATRKMGRCHSDSNRGLGANVDSRVVRLSSGPFENG